MGGTGRRCALAGCGLPIDDVVGRPQRLYCTPAHRMAARQSRRAAAQRERQARLTGVPDRSGHVESGGPRGDEAGWAVLAEAALAIRAAYAEQQWLAAAAAAGRGRLLPGRVRGTGAPGVGPPRRPGVRPEQRVLAGLVGPVRLGTRPAPGARAARPSAQPGGDRGGGHRRRQLRPDLALDGGEPRPGRPVGSGPGAPAAALRAALGGPGAGHRDLDRRAAGAARPHRAALAAAAPHRPAAARAGDPQGRAQPAQDRADGRGSTPCARCTRRGPR